MKWQLLLIMALMFPLVYAINECKGVMLPSTKDIPCLVISTWEYPGACSDHAVQVYYLNSSSPVLRETTTMGAYGSTGRCNITFTYLTKGSYLMNFSTGDSGKIIIEGEDNMTSLSVTIFILGITGTLIFLGMKKDFSKNAVANLILKRCLILIGMLLMSLNTAIIVTMADVAGLGVDRELFRYLWIINWSIYLFMLFIIITTVFNVLKLWVDISQRKRMGEDEYY